MGGTQYAKLDYFVRRNTVRSCRNELHETIARVFQVNSIGILYFKEPLTLVKVLSILLIIAGVAGLNLGGVKH
jgi:hypothetical protein